MVVVTGEVGGTGGGGWEEKGTADEVKRRRSSSSTSTMKYMKVCTNKKVVNNGVRFCPFRFA